jgi:hypothetical protein
VIGLDLLEADLTEAQAAEAEAVIRTARAALF